MGSYNIFLEWQCFLSKKMLRLLGLLGWLGLLGQLGLLGPLGLLGLLGWLEIAGVAASGQLGEVLLDVLVAGECQLVVPLLPEALDEWCL